MRKRKNSATINTHYEPYYWAKSEEEIKEVKTKRVSTSNFLLSYHLSTEKWPYYGYQPLPKKFIPTESPSNDSFWTKWYLEKLGPLNIPPDKDASVHVYWKGDKLRCNWSIKPKRHTFYYSQLTLHFEKYNQYTNTKDIWVRIPEVITDISTSLTPTSTAPTRPQSKEKLNRFRGSHLLLTYSKLPQDFVDSLFTNESGTSKTSEEVKNFLKSARGWDKSLHANIHSIVISREMHKDGTPHIHLYCHIPNLPRSINVYSLDIWTGLDWSHPNIQSSKPVPTQAISYAIKDGDFIADPWILIEKIPTGEYKYFTTDKYLRYLVRTRGLEEAEDFYEYYDFDNYTLNWAKILPELQTINKSYLAKRIDSRQSKFDKKGPEFPILYNNPNYSLLLAWVNKLNGIEDWWGNSANDTLPCSLILLGPANIGKGEFIRAHLRKFIAEGTVVWAQSKDDLSRVRPYRTKIVVLDDLAWRVKGVFGETESSASRLLSTIDDRSVERRYSPDGFFLPERTVIIIISNPNKLPNFMGGDLNTENSRKLTDKEEAYIIANPYLYTERIRHEDQNNAKPKSKRYKKAARYNPYKLEDLPPEKHREAGYCDEPGLHYVPLDIYPKRTHILRFTPEDILFDPKTLLEPKRQQYDNPSFEQSKLTYLEELYKYGFLDFIDTFPPKNVNLDPVYDLFAPDTKMGKSIQEKISKLKSKEKKPLKSPSGFDKECKIWDINPSE